MTEIAGMLKEDNEFSGNISFNLKEPAIFDRNVKDVTVFYKLVGESRFKLFRNNAFELVFVHLTEDWMRQVKVNLNEVNCSGSIEVALTWDEKEDTMTVRCPGEDGVVSAKAMQIDN